MAMPCGNEDGFFITIVTLPAFAVALFFVKASLPLTALICSLVADRGDTGHRAAGDRGHEDRDGGAAGRDEDACRTSS